MKIKYRFTALFFILFNFTKFSFANDVLFVAENLPPYHYLDNDDQPSGFLVEIVKAVVDVANINADIEIMPFARGYRTTLNQANVFMLSLLKTPKRAENFQWVGQTYQATAFLVGLKNRAAVSLTTIDDAKKHIVGTIRGYHSEEYLKKAGFNSEENLYLAVRYEQMWQMLFKGRIDFILTNFIALEQEMESIGFNTDDIKPYIQLKNFPSELYIATGLTTPQQTVTKLKKALATIKKNGTYQKIMTKWGL
ncbi:MAG: transporter substrate-binding domain-containing protein [Colwellia sp.]|nr:transporter substrate-binding domain-containing protein [Colwellia sp.]